MPTPLNPLIVARIRKFWIDHEYLNMNNWGVRDLLDELNDWVPVLGPGPIISKCECCDKNLDFNWIICDGCGTALICQKCYICRQCEDAYRSDGCDVCGDSCGAYACSTCKKDDNM